MPRRAYSYTRVSDSKQARLGKDGLRRQDDFAQKLAAEEGWVLDDTLTFTDAGTSAFHQHNLDPAAALTQFLGHIGGRITPGSVLIVENLDRLSRAAIDQAYDLFRRILSAGVWIATREPRRIYKREDSGNMLALLEPLFIFSRAHEESATKSMRIGDAWKARRTKARENGTPYGRRCPEWLQLTPNGYAIAPGAEATIQTIFRLACEGLGVLRLTTWLNDHKGEHPAFGERTVWLRSYVRKILRSRCVIGEYQPHQMVNDKPTPSGPPIAGYYPAAVSPDEWDLAQAALNGRRRKAGRPGAVEANLFTGTVFEATTRLRMSIDGRSAGNTPGKVYRHLVAYQQGSSCRLGKGLPYQQFEDGVLGVIHALLPKEVLPSGADDDARERRIAELTHRGGIRADQLATLDHQIKDPANVKVMNRLIENLNEIEAIGQTEAAELARLQFETRTGRGQTLAEAKTLIDLMREKRGTPEEPAARRRVKAILRYLIKEIWVYVQPINQRAYVGHAQIHLCSGARCNVRILPVSRHGTPSRGAALVDLSGYDFRAGEVPDAEAHG